jgi:predicted nucleic acid-binding protein
VTTDLRVVADAGPLIHLDELSSLELLADFEIVHVASFVLGEVVRHRPGFPKSAGWLSVSSPILPSRSSLQVLARTLGLHRGELSAIQLCQELDAGLFLCDDSAARLAAESLGFKVHGTLGILIRAFRLGMRTTSETLSTLRAIPTSSSLHVRLSLLEEIITQVENWRPSA